jgi:hypothetical protein
MNLNALTLLENFSRLACHCDALVFLFYRSPVTPLPERAVTRYFLFLPVSLEIDLPLRIADKTNERRTPIRQNARPLAATNSGH